MGLQAAGRRHCLVWLQVVVVVVLVLVLALAMIGLQEASLLLHHHPTQQQL